MIRVRVPATSANIGPGFDALGVAVRLYNDFYVDEGAGDVEITGCPDEFAGPDNLFAHAYRRGMEELGRPFHGVCVRIDAAIPLARGLGSSAAMISGGLAAASAASAGSPAAPEGRPTEFDRDFTLRVAAAMEGHPDNAAPAVLGGFCAAIMSGGRPLVSRFALDPALRFNAMIPPFELPTAQARAVLPATLPLKDAAFNAGRAAMVACAFAGGDWSLLAEACEDRIHQPWRAPLIPGYAEIVDACKKAGALAVWLSGAGPTIMALTDSSAPGSGDAFAHAVDPVLAARPEGAWKRLSLEPDNSGIVIERPA